MEMSAPELSASMKPYTPVVSDRVKAYGLSAYLRPGLGNCTKIVDKVSLGHTDTSITKGEDFVLLVGGDANKELLLGVEYGGVGEGGIADFVQGI